MRHFLVCFTLIFVCCLVALDKRLALIDTVVPTITKYQATLKATSGGCSCGQQVTVVILFILFSWGSDHWTTFRLTWKSRSLTTNSRNSPMMSKRSLRSLRTMTASQRRLINLRTKSTTTGKLTWMALYYFQQNMNVSFAAKSRTRETWPRNTSTSKMSGCSEPCTTIYALALGNMVMNKHNAPNCIPALKVTEQSETMRTTPPKWNGGTASHTVFP